MQALLVHKEQGDRKAQEDPRDHEVPQAHQAHQVTREMLDQMVHQDVQDPVERTEPVVQQAFSEKRVMQESRDLLGQWDQLGTRDSLDLREFKGLQDP
jgi:hypothetical protein